MNKQLPDTGRLAHRIDLSRNRFEVPGAQPINGGPGGSTSHRIHLGIMLIAALGLVGVQAGQGPTGPEAAENGTPPSAISVDLSRRLQTLQGFGLNFTAPYFRDDQKAIPNMPPPPERQRENCTPSVASDVPRKLPALRHFSRAKTPHS